MTADQEEENVCNASKKTKTKKTTFPLSHEKQTVVARFKRKCYTEGK